MGVTANWISNSNTMPTSTVVSYSEVTHCGLFKVTRVLFSIVIINILHFLRCKWSHVKKEREKNLFPFGWSKDSEKTVLLLDNCTLNLLRETSFVRMVRVPKWSFLVCSWSCHTVVYNTKFNCVEVNVLFIIDLRFKVLDRWRFFLLTASQLLLV